MASLQFKGDLSGITERQEQFIREVIEQQGFLNNDILFEVVGKSGDNYVANVKRITIVVNGKDDISMIAKIAPQHEIQRKFMNTALMFNNEILMYEQILPKFTSLQESVNVSENERLKYAKCYGGFLEAPNEVLLLEDLKKLDYVMLDRFVPLDEDAVKSTLKNFSILHSLSYALKHLEPETFEDFSKNLVDIMGMVDQQDSFQSVLSQTEANTVAVLQDENYKKVVQGVVSNWFNINSKVHKYNNPKHLIIQQGDAWTNNIMFKIEDEKIVDSIMIDYQLSKAANPVCDLLYMIFNCTDHVSRSKHYHEWINYYHKELERSLSNFGLKANLIFSKDQLDADLKMYSKSYFCMSVLLYGMLTRTEDEAANIQDAMKSSDIEQIENNLSTAHLSKATIDLFRSKITDLIDSYREFGYLA